MGLFIEVIVGSAELVNHSCTWIAWITIISIVSISSLVLFSWFCEPLWFLSFDALQLPKVTTRLHKESTRNHRELVAYYEVVDSITTTRTIPIGVAYWLLVGVFRYKWSFVWVGVSHKEWEGVYDLNTYSKVLTLLFSWVDGRPAVYGVYEWIYTLVALPLLEGHLASRTEWVVADVGQWRITRNRTIIPRRRTINWGTKASVGHIGITWSSHCNTVSHISHSLVSRQFRGGLLCIYSQTQRHSEG